MPFETAPGIEPSQCLMACLAEFSELADAACWDHASADLQECQAEPGCCLGAQWKNTFHEWLRLPYQEKRRDLTTYLSGFLRTHTENHFCVAIHLRLSPRPEPRVFSRLLCDLHVCACASPAGSRPFQRAQHAGETFLVKDARHQLWTSAERVLRGPSAGLLRTLRGRLSRVQRGVCQRGLCVPHYFGFPPPCTTEPDLRLFVCAMSALLARIRAQQAAVEPNRRSTPKIRIYSGSGGWAWGCDGADCRLNVTPWIPGRCPGS